MSRRKADVKYSLQLNVRLSRQMMDSLDKVCEFRGLKPSTLVRIWIRDRLDEILRSRAYNEWVEEQESRKDYRL